LLKKWEEGTDLLPKVNAKLVDNLFLVVVDITSVTITVTITGRTCVGNFHSSKQADIEIIALCGRRVDAFVLEHFHGYYPFFSKINLVVV
jgi:hypothetical protein